MVSVCVLFANNLNFPINVKNFSPLQTPLNTALPPKMKCRIRRWVLYNRTEATRHKAGRKVVNMKATIQLSISNVYS